MAVEPVVVMAEAAETVARLDELSEYFALAVVERLVHSPPGADERLANFGDGRVLLEERLAQGRLVEELALHGALSRLTRAFEGGPGAGGRLFEVTDGLGDDFFLTGGGLETFEDTVERSTAERTAHVAPPMTSPSTSDHEPETDQTCCAEYETEHDDSAWP